MVSVTRPPGRPDAARAPAEGRQRASSAEGPSERVRAVPWHALALAGVLLLAIVARFWGLLYGLPHSFYPDESSVVGDALNMAATGDPRPQQFLWPTFWIYVVAISIRLGLLLSWVPGGLGPLGVPSLDNSTYVYGIARTVTALSGVVTVWAVYAIGSRALPRLGMPQARTFALLGAAFLALAPLHIQHAHVVSPDVPTTAFVAFTLLFTLRALESGALRWYVLAGLSLGLASAAKYPSAMFAVAIVVAHLGRTGLHFRRPLQLVTALLDRRLWLAGALTIGTFFLTSPYILIDWRRFQADFVSQAARVLQRGPVGEVGVTGPFAPVLYVPLAMDWGLDRPVALLALVGLLWAAWAAIRPPASHPRARWLALTLLVFPLAMYVFSWSWQHRFARYLVPLVPFGCLLAALGLARLASLLPGGFSPRSAGLVVGIAALLWQADGVVRYDTLLTQSDTRVIAAQWLEQNLPPGETVLVEWYGPPYRNVRQMGFDLSDRPLDRYIGRTPRFAVTSSFTYDRWLRDPDAYPKRATFYTGLEQQAKRLYEIRPHPELAYDPVQEGWDGWHSIPISEETRPGPVLRVYQLTP